MFEFKEELLVFIKQFNAFISGLNNYEDEFTSEEHRKLTQSIIEIHDSNKKLKSVVLLDESFNKIKSNLSNIKSDLNMYEKLNYLSPKLPGFKYALDWTPVLRTWSQEMEEYFIKSGNVNQISIEMLEKLQRDLDIVIKNRIAK